MSKQEIIGNIYFDKAGIGSKNATLKDAREKDKFTIKDVEYFFKQNVEIKKNPRGYNSFVALHNNHTYQVDTFFISKKYLKVKLSRSARVARADTQPLTRSGKSDSTSHSATQPLSHSEWLSGCVSRSARVAEWLSGCGSHSGRVAEWLSACFDFASRVAHPLEQQNTAKFEELL